MAEPTLAQMLQQMPSDMDGYSEDQAYRGRWRNPSYRSGAVEHAIGPVDFLTPMGIGAGLLQEGGAPGMDPRWRRQMQNRALAGRPPTDEQQAAYDAGAPDREARGEDLATQALLSAVPMGAVGRALVAAPRATAAGISLAASLMGMSGAGEAEGGKGRPKGVPATQDQLATEQARQAAPGYNPVAEAKGEIDRLERRIAENAAKITAIAKTSTPGNAATALEKNRMATAPLQAQIEADQAALDRVRTVAADLDQTGKPLREKYPALATAATVAGPLLAGGMAKYGMSKIASSLDDAVTSAMAKEAAGDSVGFVRAAQVAGNKASSAPLKQAATVGAAATIPADVQNLMDVTDYKAAPRWSRAYKEAETTFADPTEWAKRQVPALASGAIGATVGAKLAPSAPRAEARSMAQSLNGLDDRPTLSRMLQSQQSPEQLAPKMAKRWEDAATADVGVVQARDRLATARADAAGAQQQQALQRQQQAEAAALAPGAPTPAGAASPQAAGPSAGPNPPPPMGPPPAQQLPPATVPNPPPALPPPSNQGGKTSTPGAGGKRALTQAEKDNVLSAVEARMSNGMTLDKISAADLGLPHAEPLVAKQLDAIRGLYASRPKGAEGFEAIRWARENKGKLGVAGTAGATATQDDTSPTGHRDPTSGRFAPAP